MLEFNEFALLKLGAQEQKMFPKIATSSAFRMWRTDCLCWLLITIIRPPSKLQILQSYEVMMSKKKRTGAGGPSAKKPTLNAPSGGKKPPAKVSPGDDSHQDIERRIGQFTGKGEPSLKLGSRRDKK